MRSPLIHLLFAAAFGLAAVVGYGVLYIAVSNEGNRVADLQNQIAAAHETVNRGAAARTMLAQTAGDEAKIQSYFVSESEVVVFINSLESLGLAQKATVSVLSVAAKDSSVQPSLQLSLSVQGTFDAVMRTIGAIEYAPYAISIPTLSIQHGAKDVWRADIDLVVGSIAVKTTKNTL